MKFVRLWRNKGGYHNVIVKPGYKYVHVFDVSALRSSRLKLKDYESRNPSELDFTWERLYNKIKERVEFLDRAGQGYSKTATRTMLNAIETIIQSGDRRV